MYSNEDLERIELLLHRAIAMPPQEEPDALDHAADLDPYTTAAYLPMLDASTEAASCAIRVLSNLRVSQGRLEDHASALLLNVSSWIGRQGHAQRRVDLIALLTELRNHVLDSLRVLPQAPRAVAAKKASTTWQDRSDKERRILEVLSGKQLSGKEIADALGEGDPNSVYHQMRNLTKHGIVQNKKGVGYWICKRPTGAPSSIQPPRIDPTAESTADRRSKK